MQPDPKRRRRSIKINNTADMENYEENFINEFSSLYSEKYNLEVQLEEQKAVVEEQRQIIEKLKMVASNHSVAVQTEDIQTVHVAVQTEYFPNNEPSTSTASTTPISRITGTFIVLLPIEFVLSYTRIFVCCSSNKQ